jgi:hypothetical protein
MRFAGAFAYAEREVSAMSSPLWSILFGVFLIVHGVGHAAGFYLGNRAFAALWVPALAGFIAAGLAFFGAALPHEWWRPLAVASASLSMFVIIAFWPPAPGPKLNALLANVGILFAVLWLHWPVPRTGP